MEWVDMDKIKIGTILHLGHGINQNPEIKLKKKKKKIYASSESWFCLRLKHVTSRDCRAIFPISFKSNMYYNIFKNPSFCRIISLFLNVSISDPF